MIEYERGAGFLGCHVEDNKEKNKRHRVMYGCKRLNLELKTWLTEVGEYGTWIVFPGTSEWP
ncbi:hypothetical protein F9C07_11492 [Aspergillus flavus]|uniref:Uncharacterized protein n=1 Tax=Aspergillus flavus (strain ATCC 200026 / FGSC A1120 / IAM 13836 / NRRL 3357 / JCM 12722 / SRRC 167) TaxID=332952 RepID=A0A7U2N3C6_ASPFN|nr:hypothetical protein F9C07_11492 [Aspergillus flavus]